MTKQNLNFNYSLNQALEEARRRGYEVNESIEAWKQFDTWIVPVIVQSSFSKEEEKIFIDYCKSFKPKRLWNTRDWGSLLYRRYGNFMHDETIRLARAQGDAPYRLTQHLSRLTFKPGIGKKESFVQVTIPSFNRSPFGISITFWLKQRSYFRCALKTVWNPLVNNERFYVTQSCDDERAIEFTYEKLIEMDALTEGKFKEDFLIMKERLPQNIYFQKIRDYFEYGDYFQ